MTPSAAGAASAMQTTARTREMTRKIRRLDLERLVKYNSPRVGGGSIDNDAADRFSGAHQLKALVDLGEWKLVSNQIVDIDLFLHIPIDDPRHIGPTLGAAKRASFPHPA